MTKIANREPRVPGWVWRGSAEPIRRAVAAALVDLAPVTPPTKRGRGRAMPEVRDDSPLVLIACSGGADSLALAIGTAHVGPRLGLRVGAVIVDHRLQNGSDAVSAEAQRQCLDLGLDPVIIRTVEVQSGKHGSPGVLATDEPDHGIEANARRARYRALDEEAARLNAAAVLLGHTLDDQAETVLLGLARGAGTRSLAGMPATRGSYRRPLLGVRRTETEATCHAAGLEFWLDPMNVVASAVTDSERNFATSSASAPVVSHVASPTTNPLANTADSPLFATGHEPAPLRSRVRSEVIPVMRAVLGPGLDEALARTADHLREDADYLDGLADDLTRAARMDEVPEGRTAAAYAASALAAAPKPVRRRALRRIIIAAGAPSGDVSFAHVLAVEGLISSWHGQGPISLPGGVEATRRCDTLITSFQQQ